MTKQTFYLFSVDVAEERDLVADGVLDRLFAPANDDVRRNSEATKLPDTGLKESERYQSDIHIKVVLNLFCVRFSKINHVSYVSLREEPRNIIICFCDFASFICLY